jgi:protein-L-isoaspartate(D-aspartate) O-methyltransferase
MHATAAESLLPHLSSRPDARVLDIGSGSGYLTAVLASLLGPQARVIGIDHIQGLVDLANRNVAKSEQGRQWLESGKVRFVKGDGRLGFADDDGDDEGGERERERGYDAIHVGAAAKEAHEVLVRQLRRPGRLFIPVGEDVQFIWIIDKMEDGTVVREKQFGVRYVPLTDAPT